MAADTLHQLAHSGRVASAQLTDDDVHAYGTLTPSRVAEWLAEWETAIPVTEADRRDDTTWWAGMESQVACLRSQYASLELDKDLRDAIASTFQRINSIAAVSEPRATRKEKGKGKARKVQVKADVSAPRKAAGSSSKQTDLSNGAPTPRDVDVAITAPSKQPKKKVGAGQATRPYRILLYSSKCTECARSRSGSICHGISGIQKCLPCASSKSLCTRTVHGSNNNNTTKELTRADLLHLPVPYIDVRQNRSNSIRILIEAVRRAFRATGGGDEEDAAAEQSSQSPAGTRNTRNTLHELARWAEGKTIEDVRIAYSDREGPGQSRFMFNLAAPFEPSSARALAVPSSIEAVVMPTHAKHGARKSAADTKNTIQQQHALGDHDDDTIIITPAQKKRKTGVKGASVVNVSRAAKARSEAPAVVATSRPKSPSPSPSGSTFSDPGSIQDLSSDDEANSNSRHPSPGVPLSNTLPSHSHSPPPPPPLPSFSFRQLPPSTDPRSLLSNGLEHLEHPYVLERRALGDQDLSWSARVMARVRNPSPTPFAQLPEAEQFHLNRASSGNDPHGLHHAIAVNLRFSRIHEAAKRSLVMLSTPEPQCKGNSERGIPRGRAGEEGKP
ncbi:hypothetical protein SCHPADRAFT_1002555 [Schizopora paradoxa]|uniref:Uncharacterized protein n=1 Tax=Schizopora paradoxa TaxID=27342 RepID=A0A0H2R2N9_9AGAM|nr:hypothetical protein SCHPADRAFT_1002555 [Schizopora paradoxa]